MRTSEHESPQRVRDAVDGIFERHLEEARRAIRADLVALDEHYSPSQIQEALILALILAKAGRS